MYRRLNISYAYGLPTGTTPGRGSHAFASVFWEGNADTSVQTLDTVIVSIFRPGEEENGILLQNGQAIWPGDKYAETAWRYDGRLEPDRQNYPCQVLRIRRVLDKSSDTLVPVPADVKLRSSMQRRFSYWRLYADFNASLSAALAADYYR